MNNYKELQTRHKGLIYKIIQKYPREHHEDLMQEAYIALYQASLVWDPKRASFSTLARRYMNSACYKYFRYKSKIVKSSDCASLDEFISEDRTLEDLIGFCNDNEITDVHVLLSDVLLGLVEKNIISLEDLALLRLKYENELSYDELSSYFKQDSSSLALRIKKIMSKIRPRFFKKNVRNLFFYE